MQPDAYQGELKGIYFDVYNKNKVSLKEQQEKQLSSLLNLRIKDTFLLKMPIENIRRTGNYGVTIMGVNGVGIEFENKKTLIIYIGFTQEQFDGIYLSLGTELIGKDYFNKSKEFFKHGKIYDFALAENFTLNEPIDINNRLIERSNVLKNTLIDIQHPLESAVSKERLIKIIQTVGDIDYKKQLIFFKSLRETLIEKEFGLVDLKFGLDKKHNFKIVKPIDFVSVYQENIVFIDSIIKVFNEFPDV